MTRRKAKGTLAALAALAMLAVLAVAGRQDFNEAVYTEMGHDTYHAIRDSLGHGATLSQVVDAYLDNREYWKQQEARP